jgi:hypothetical protein
MLGYGLAYAIASLSCTIGPFLAVTAGTFRSGSVLDGVLAYLAYGTGMALLVGVLAVATALASTTVARGARRLLPHVNRISGVLLVVVGLYVGYYGIYELRLFLGDGPASDPVVDAAGRLQGILANWVDSIGPLPWLLLLAVLLGATVLFTRSRRRHSHTPSTHSGR